MIKVKEANEIYTNWLNGNRADVRRIMRKKSKAFALDLTFYIGTELNDFRQAIYEVTKMVE